MRKNQSTFTTAMALLITTTIATANILDSIQNCGAKLIKQWTGIWQLQMGKNTTTNDNNNDNNNSDNNNNDNDNSNSNNSNVNNVNNTTNNNNNNGNRNNMLVKLKSDFDILPSERTTRHTNNRRTTNITTKTNATTTTTTITTRTPSRLLVSMALLMWLLAASMTAHCCDSQATTTITAATSTPIPTPTPTPTSTPHMAGSSDKTTDCMNNSSSNNNKNNCSNNNNNKNGSNTNNNNNNCTSNDSSNSSDHNIWRLISRQEWKAATPTEIVHFSLPIDYVIVHHSYQPGVCATTDACMASMRSMQRYHMAHNLWSDIGYSFAVGGDGNVYEGRGFGVVGAHAPHYNNRSIGLLLIGNFEIEMPPKVMIEVTSSFLQYALDLGVLRKNYILYGHRQVRATSCPGDMLYENIKLWPHWRLL